MCRLSWLSLLCGCGEVWVSYDRAWIDLSLQPGQTVQVDLSVRTSPGAWPRSTVGEAIRTGFDTAPNRQDAESVPDVRITSPEGREVIDFPSGGLNVLDVWRDCDREAVCQAIVPLWITCDRAIPCEGGLFAEALITANGPARENPEGVIALQIRGPIPITR